MRPECKRIRLHCQALFRGGLCKKRNLARGQKTKKAKQQDLNNNNNNKKNNEDKDKDDNKG
jgi:hypothetical protein